MDLEPNTDRPTDTSDTPNIPQLSTGTLAGRVGIAEASRHFGISREGVRQRIRRGQLDAVKGEGQWWVAPHVDQTSRVNGEGDLPPAVPRTVGPAPAPNSAPTRTVNSRAPPPVQAQLEAENAFLRQECERLHELVRSEQETRRREVSELHVLLQRAQA